MVTVLRQLAASGFLVASASAIMAAQNSQATAGDVSPLQPLPGQVLSTLPSLAQGPAGATEVTIRWRLGLGSSPVPPVPGRVQAGGQFDVVARRPVESGFVRERDPQVAPDELVLIAIGASGAPIAWQHIKDPRIVRAESPGPDGILSGQTLHRPLTELVVLMPDGVPATELRVYQPQWTGQAFTLAPLGTVALNP
jgi:hypothetical protein